MATRSRFFDDVGGDREYDSSAWADVFSALVGDGYVTGRGNQLSVVENSPQAMSVRVNTGGAWVQGRFFDVYSAPEVVTIAAADPTNPRIDRIVVRLHYTNRTITLVDKQGTPAATPTAPALQRDATIWELSLAQVRVEAGVTTIVNAKITDERSNTSVMGQAKMPDLAAHQAAATLDHPDSSVTTAKIAANAVTGAKIAAGVITQTHIGNLQIQSTHINDGAVTEAKLGTGAVTANKLGAGAVTSSKITWPITGANLTAPTIADLTNMQHQHGNAAGGGSTLAPLTAHAALTATHGVSSALVGINDIQTLANKGLTSPLINNIELYNGGSAPFIDFRLSDPDFDARLSLLGVNELNLTGANFTIDAGATVDGMDPSSHIANNSAHHDINSNGYNLTPATILASGAIRTGSGVAGWVQADNDAVYGRFQVESEPRWYVSRDALGAGKAGMGFAPMAGTLAGDGGFIGQSAGSRTVSLLVSNGSAIGEKLRADVNGVITYVPLTVNGNTVVNGTVGITGKVEAAGGYRQPIYFKDSDVSTAAGGTNLIGATNVQEWVAVFAGSIVGISVKLQTGVTVPAGQAATYAVFINGITTAFGVTLGPGANRGTATVTRNTHNFAVNDGISVGEVVAPAGVGITDAVITVFVEA